MPFLLRLPTLVSPYALPVTTSAGTTSSLLGFRASCVYLHLRSTPSFRLRFIDIPLHHLSHVHYLFSATFPFLTPLSPLLSSRPHTLIMSQWWATCTDLTALSDDELSSAVSDVRSAIEAKELALPKAASRLALHENAGSKFLSRSGWGMFEKFECPLVVPNSVSRP